MGANTSTISADSQGEIERFSHFPPKDIQSWSQSFRNEFTCGYMTQKDLEAIFKTFFPFGSPENFTKRLYDTINISQTGKVDFHEFLIAFSILTKGSNHEKLRWIFRFYDKDNDGVISRKELEEAVQDLIDMTSCTLDTNFNPDECVDEIFSVVKNESGMLNFEDFKSLATEKKTIFSMIALFVDFNI